MSRSWRLVVPALLGGLLLGVWIGARCERSVERRMRREGPNPERVIKMLRRKIKLRDDQIEPVRRILEAKQPVFAAARREEQARRASLRAEIDKDVAPLLDDAQKKRLEELRARWDKREKEPEAANAR